MSVAPGARPEVATILVSLALAFATPGAVAHDTEVAAVWMPQRVTFSFVGQNVFYACDVLERRLQQVLIVLGAHEAMHVDRRACSPYTGILVDITFMSPVAATPENIRALTTFDTKQQLVARLRSIHLPLAEDIRPFPAELQLISLSHDPRLQFRAGDCELLEAIRRQLLPRLKTGDIPQRLVCGSSHIYPRPPRLSVSALVASVRRPSDTTFSPSARGAVR